MDWLKRHLFFVIGGVIGLGLMGLAGYYLYGNIEKNNEVLQDLRTQQARLRELVNKKPHPGNNEVNNIEAAREQQKRVQQWIAEASTTFQPIPRSATSDQGFNLFLLNTVHQLEQTARSSGVRLPDEFNFSFTAQKSLLKFATGSVEAVSIQLSEVKAICGVLFEARVNALDEFKRAKVSLDDSGPSARSTDYTELPLRTNELTQAIISPYEVTFRCFSPELAKVMDGFIKLPHGALVKTIELEPSNVALTNLTADATPAVPTPTFYTMTPTYTPAAPAPSYGGGDARMASRYGAPASPYARSDSAASRYGATPPGGADPRMAQRYGGGAAAQPAAPARPSWLPPDLQLPTVTAKPTTTTTFLSDRPLKVKMLIEMIKLKPATAK